MEQNIFSILRKLNHGIAILIGVVLFACAGIVLLDIVLRQTGTSLGGTDEISGYVMAIVTSWGMAYTLVELGHVRIDILRTRLRQRNRVLMDLFAMTIMAGTVSLIAFKSWPVVARSLSNGSTANTPLETPLALVQAPWFAGWVWFAFVSWCVLFIAILQVAKGNFDASEDTIGTIGEAEQNT